MDLITDEDEKIRVKPKKRRIKKKSIAILICIVVLIILLIVGLIYFKKKNNNQKLEEEKVALIKEIESHYGDYVKVINDTKLYNEERKEIGKIYKNQELELIKEDFDDKTEYFKINDLGLVSYLDVLPINELIKSDERYKNYIPFNKNIVLKENYTLYNENGDKAYSFKESDEYPILIDDYDGKYYIEYQNKLMYVLKDDVLKTVEHDNSTKKNAAKVTTLCYHRIYDETQKCNDIYVCKKMANFDKEMKYLKDNNYYTFTMEEMYLYLTGKLQIEKAVLVTLDDGWLVKHAIEILEKYDLKGTSFVKTGAWDDLSEFESTALELHSHTDDMHTPGVCKKEQSYQQGGGILCLSEDKVLEDLTKSRDKLNGAIALAYPFYDYNDRAMKLVKKAGFKMAFIGAGGTNGKASPGVNLYKIPRMTIWDTTSFNTWKSYL